MDANSFIYAINDAVFKVNRGLGPGIFGEVINLSEGHDVK